jgi:hypothetical protein
MDERSVRANVRSGSKPEVLACIPPGPLYPEKRTSAIQTMMSASGQNRTSRNPLSPAHGPAQLVAGAGHIGLVAQRCLLPKSGAYSCSHHAMRFLVANIRTHAPPWQIIEGRGGRIAASKTCYPGNIGITFLHRGPKIRPTAN